MSITSVKNDALSRESVATSLIPLPPTISGYIITGIDDLALDPAGGQTIEINGSGFLSGATITINGSVVSVVTYVDSNRLTFTSPVAATAGTYTIYAVNPDGGTAIYIPGLIYSNLPTWVTAAGSLASIYEYSPVSNTVAATGDGSISYSLYSGTLPPGSVLNSSTGTITGTSPASATATTYTFVILATDAQLQDSVRTFSITVNTDVVTWSTPANNSTSTLTVDAAAATTTLLATSAAGKSITYTADTLPTGLSITGATVTGTPTVITNTTSTFTATAATTNKTATRTINWSVVVAGDLYFPYTTLLLSGAAATETFVADASANNFALAVAGDTKPTRLSPYTPGYYSNYFDGTGDYLSTTVNLAIATGPFTMEAWVYLTALGSERTILNNLYWQNGNNGGWYLTTDTSNRLWLRASIGTFNSRPTVILSSSTLAANRWTHVAVVRDSNNLVSMYFNGVSAATAVTYAASLNQGTGQLFRIGAWTPDGGSQDFWSGYISNARVVVGTAVYTGTFTPSTTPLTAIANTSLLTCQSDRFVDNSTNAYAITRVGDTTISPTIPFVPNPTYATYGSTLFGVTGGLAQITHNSALDLGSGNFTVEFWLNTPGGSQTAAIVGKKASDSTNGWQIYRDAGQPTKLNGRLGLGNNFFTTSAITANTWEHWALVRTGTTIYWFKNGVLDATGTNSVNIEDATATLNIAFASTWGAYGNFYMSDLRVVKGTALYTTTFTPPSAPLTAITNTSLLTLQTNQPVSNSVFLDSSTNAFAVTRTGNASAGTFTPYGANWSNYFDGTTDKLTLPSSSAFDLSGSTWTIEFWMYSLATPPVGNDCRLLIAGANGGAASWDVQYNNNASIGFFRPYAGGPTGIYSSASTIALNTWYHIAVVCNAGSARIYINGVSVAGPVTISLPTSAAQELRIGYDDPGTVNFQYNGYLSNVRIVKGVAVYTSAFTPSTTPLTATQSSGTNISAITGTDTSLLTCQSNRFKDNSTNLFGVIKTGDVAVQRFSPFSPSAVYTAGTTSGSGYFDGTGDYISIPSNAGFQFGTGDFTIECWFYDTGTSDTYPGLISSANGWQTGSTALRFNNLATRRFALMHNPTGDPVFSSTNTFDSYQWCHVVVARSGTSLKMFVNGVQEASTTMSASISLDTTTGVFIGSGFDASSKIKGYISDVRVVKGVAVYTSAFTPPSTPLTAVTNTSLLLSMTSASIVDATMINSLETVGNSKRVATHTPYAGSYYSNLFDGTGDYLTVPDNEAFNFGAGDFTVEAWIYRTGGGSRTGSVVFNQSVVGSTSNSAYYFGAGSDGMALYLSPSGTGWTNYIETGVATTLSTWSHVVWQRRSNVLEIYLNGVLQTVIAGTSAFSGTIFNSTRSVEIGAQNAAGSLFTGYISNVRIVKGTAVYTGTFTPPTASLTATQSSATNISAITGTQTSLLTCQSNRFVDNSTNLFAVTRAGDTSVQNFNPFQRNSGSSMLFSGSSGSNPTTRVRGYGPVYNLNAANFTVEMWYYPTAHNSTGYPLLYSSYESWVSGSVYNGLIGLLAGNQNYAVGSKNKVYLTLGDNYWYGTTTVPPLNTWTHIALVRNVNRFMIFINGTMEVDTTQAAGTMTNNQLAVVGGGTDAAGLNCITGYINDFRLTKGVARYTATFTPPTVSMLIQ